MFLWELFLVLLRKHYVKRITFKGHFKILKAILWHFGHLFVDTLFTLWVLKPVSSCRLPSLLPLQAPSNGCPVSPHTEPCHRGQSSWISGQNLELISTCVLRPHTTLCVENSRRFLSDGVSYTDGCNGEWLVSFLFNFVLLFDGRQGEILAVSSPIQLKSILDFVFPSKLKVRWRHVLGTRVICRPNSYDTHVRERPATKAGGCTLQTLLPGIRVPWCRGELLQGASVLFQPGSGGWLGLAPAMGRDQPHFLNAPEI